MSRLADMEELISSVKDSEISEYLYEAYRCYGASAYRATIVIVNIALFEGLLRKLINLSPISKICKEISDEIRPLAESQKVFETPLIHKLKSHKIINDFEAQRLEQLNGHRNKAAHPSGHHPTAEEARFVFSEAIRIFLSQPIRQTTYLVDEISEKLKGDNLFPSSSIEDTNEIVKSEVANIEPAAWPYLMAKLDTALSSSEKNESSNAKLFCLGIASLRDAEAREHLFRKILAKRLTDKGYKELICEMVSCDPRLLDLCKGSHLLQLDSLLAEVTKDLGVDSRTNLVQSPVEISKQIMTEFGEKSHDRLPNFKSLIVDKAPINKGFLIALRLDTDMLSLMKERYVAIASSSKFDTANRFARRIEAVEKSFAKTMDDDTLVLILVGIMKAANTGAFGAIDLVNDSFNGLQAIKAKALAYSQADLKAVRQLIKGVMPDLTVAKFRKALR